MTPIDRTPDGADPAGHDDGDGFLARWSRRKREAARAEAAPPPAEPAPEAPIDGPQADEPDLLSAEDLAALPHVDDLTESSDLAPFLRRGVPIDLKNAALRKIWMLTPAIRDYRDPAVDYAWDWNTPGGVPGDGCAPSAEATARMLRDLVSPRGEPAETVAGTNAPTDDLTAENPSEAVPQALEMAEAASADVEALPPPPSDPARPPTASRLPLASGPAPLPAPDTPPVAAASPPARKRHGGAFPS